MHLNTTRKYFTCHRQLTNRILFIIWRYYHSRFLVSMLDHIIISLSFYFKSSILYLFLVMASMDTESSFQTPASKKRKASEPPSLPPASQSTITPTSYKNRTPLIAKGIDAKYNTRLRIMSELRQYHPSLRVFQLKQSKNGWIFIGDTPTEFAILQSEPKLQQGFGKNVKVSLPKSYHSADATKGKILVFKGVSTNVTIDDFKELLEFNKITDAEAERMASIKIKIWRSKASRCTHFGGIYMPENRHNFQGRGI